MVELLDCEQERPAWIKVPTQCGVCLFSFRKLGLTLYMAQPSTLPALYSTVRAYLSMSKTGATPELQSLPI